MTKLDASGRADAKRAPDSGLATLSFFMRDVAAFAGRNGLKAFVFVFMGAVVEGVGLMLLIPFLTVIINAGDTPGWVQKSSEYLFDFFSVESRFAKLSLLVGLFSGLLIARAIVLTARDVTLARLEVGFVQRIRSRIAHLLATARWDAISRFRHSRIVHLMSTDIRQISGATSLILQDIAAAVMLTSQLVLTFFLSPALASIALGFVLVGTVTLRPLMNRARGFGAYVADANLTLIHDVSQFLGVLKQAVSQNLQHNFVAKYDDTLNAITDRRIRFVRRQTITRLSVMTVSGLLGAVTILVGLAVLNIPLSVLITLLLIYTRMNGPALQLHQDAQRLVEILPAYEKFRELENDLVAAQEAPELNSNDMVLVPEGSIVFRDVSFLHGHDGEDARGTAGGVCGLDLVIQPGMMVGVVGPSGAGKTTFADLLVGLYRPQSGDIEIGGVSLRGPAVTAWRNVVSYVAQDNFVFHDTVRNNLLWAKPDAEEAALWEALRVAGAEPLVRDMAQGLDTVVGERGALLSGGERQRLNFARAILRRPRVLVLDEATNAIDVASEQALLERLLQIEPRPTIIMIAHRLESLRCCRRLLVFEAGKLVSEGPAEALVTQLSAAWREPLHAEAAARDAPNF